jgi:hypothetical protein
MIPSVLAALLLSWLQIPGGTWVIDEATTADAKRVLELALWDEMHGAGEELPAWSSYTFQFQGRTEDGRKLIYINALCSTPPETAATEWILVLDGGKCYFEAYYDPESKEIVSIQFNGVA